MDEFPRRTFCAVIAASAGALSGCNFMSQNPPTPSTKEPPSDNQEIIVTNRKELEAAFANLSPGDTIRISSGNAPYRTRQWLDIDVDGVTVIGPEMQTLIKPANGANVGGIRIGKHNRCQEIDVRGIGFHGNPKGQGKNAERLHGIAVQNASSVTIERNQIRKTYPRKHGNGGSGISVSRKCSGVQILNNTIDGFGDRGVQLAGKHLVVYGNEITNGLDRPIACDLWYPDGKNQTAQSVSIFGNLLGNSVEGSLVGVARNTPVGSNNNGYVSVFGNVGFGSHKNFCHIRGPKSIQNISIQNNASIQKTDQLKTEKTKKFAGIAVDVKKGSNLAIKNNELYDYSGHGIHVNSDASDVSIQNNMVASTGLTGIRLVGGKNGLVSDNFVTNTKKAGIHLQKASHIAVRGNHVRKAGAAGIVTRGTKGKAGHDIGANYLINNSQETQAAPAIFVRDSGVRVRGNSIHQDGVPAIAEDDGAANNLYEGNWATGDQPWRINSPTSRVRNNTPSIDAHRDVSADSGSDVAYIEFDQVYSRRPQLTFGRVGGGVQDVSYKTDENGDYVGAKITVGRVDGTVDVFVNDG